MTWLGAFEYRCPVPLRRRFWIEAGLAAISAVALVLTAAWPDWIEEVLAVAPDGGSGAVEWAIVAALVVCAVALPELARREWRRAHPTF